MTKTADLKATSTPTEEIHCISYLRGLAALGVVFYHVKISLWIGFNAIREDPSLAASFAGFTAWLSVPTIFMGSGVMLFFVISGFCIHYPYAGAGGKRLDISEYTVRRFFRIYPPYVVAVFFAFGVQWLGWHYGFLPALDVPNYQLSVFLLQNNFGNQPACNPALWTIPIEVSFYIVFPLVYVGLRRSCFTTLGAGLVVSLLAIALSLYTSIQACFLPYWVIWIAGAVLAERYKQGKLRTPPFGMLMLAMLSFLWALFCSWRLLPGQVPLAEERFGEFMTLLGTLGYGTAFAIFLWWSLANRWFYDLAPSYLHRSLLHLGDVSYSLYLFHIPLFCVCGWIWATLVGGKPVNYLMTIPFVILAVLVASLAYRWIEAPAHIVGRKLASAIKSRRAARAQTAPFPGST